MYFFLLLRRITCLSARTVLAHFRTPSSPPVSKSDGKRNKQKTITFIINTLRAHVYIHTRLIFCYIMNIYKSVQADESTKNVIQESTRKHTRTRSIRGGGGAVDNATEAVARVSVFSRPRRTFRDSKKYSADFNTFFFFLLLQYLTREYFYNIL